MALVLNNLTKNEAVILSIDVVKIIEKLYNENKIIQAQEPEGEMQSIITIDSLKTILYELQASIICRINNEFDLDFIIGAPRQILVSRRSAKGYLPHLTNKNSSSGR